MYKNASRNLQRRARKSVVAPVAQAGFTADEDLIQSAANLSKEECLSERRQLIVELTKIQNSLLAAKNIGDKRAVEAEGLRQQNIQKRLGLIKERLNAIQDADPSDADAFRKAVIEIVPQELLNKIYIRHRELRRDSDRHPHGRLPQDAVSEANRARAAGIAQDPSGSNKHG